MGQRRDGEVRHSWHGNGVATARPSKSGPKGMVKIPPFLEDASSDIAIVGPREGVLDLRRHGNGKSASTT